MTPLVIGYLVGLFTMLAINFVRGCSECEGCAKWYARWEGKAAYALELEGILREHPVPSQGEQFDGHGPVAGDSLVTLPSGRDFEWSALPMSAGSGPEKLYGPSSEGSF